MHTGCIFHSTPCTSFISLPHHVPLLFSQEEPNGTWARRKTSAADPWSGQPGTALCEFRQSHREAGPNCFAVCAPTLLLSVAAEQKLRQVQFTDTEVTHCLILVLVFWFSFLGFALILRSDRPPALVAFAPTYRDIAGPENGTNRPNCS